MRFCVLGSGSKGNCTFIESGKTRILIDAGFSGVEIERRLSSIGVDIATISAILVTHEHSDHVRGVGVVARRCGIPVYACPATISAFKGSLRKTSGIREFETGVSFSFQNLVIHPFSISHDAADPVGFIVQDNGCSVGYCTDTGTVSRLMKHRLSGCNGLVLESNHDPQMLMNGPYPPVLKQRVRSNTGHLANSDAAKFIVDLKHDSLMHVVLAHISETNNHPDLVLKTVSEILGSGGSSTKAMYCGNTRITLARQHCAGEFVDLKKDAG